MKRGILLLLSFLTLTPPLFAAENMLESSYEFGRREASGQVDEEDLVDEFDYSKYVAKATTKIDPKNSYYAKYQYYYKGYDTTVNLNNTYQAAGFGTDNIIYSRDGFSAKIGPDFQYKNKSYKNSPNNQSYDQIMFDIPFILKKEKDWTLKLTGGMNSYIYSYLPKNELRTNGKVDFSKKFMDEALTLSGFYKFQYVSRENRSDRYERNIGGSADVEFESPFIKGIEGGITHGMDNTKVAYDEREDSFDYNSVTWYGKMKAALFDIMKDTVKYSHYRRNYDDFKDNFDGNMVENTWSMRVLEKKDLTADLKVTYLYKQFRFVYVANPFSYYSNFITPELEFAKKDDWKAWMLEETKFYRFTARRGNDKIYYIAKLGCEKYFLKRDLSLGFEYRYTFKNFLHKSDIIENAFRIKANYRF